MSSGTLPLNTYHRAQALGAGSFGSVIAVYNDEGEEFALKLFDDEEEDESEDGMNIGALRELSILRILRASNRHPNIIEINDIQPGLEADDGEEGGAGTKGYMAMAMPLFPQGSLHDALEGNKITSRRQKVVLAHTFLNAVAHLHANSIIHRDIKSDNILLQVVEKATHADFTLQSVLIDFSLAKIIDPSIMIPGFPSTSDANSETELTHTPSIGTPTYRAPEVLEGKAYGLPSDMWSVGVVLLEVLSGSPLKATKDKEALAMIEDALQSLPPDQPFPTLIRGLLQVDPKERWTARQALQSPLFEKHGLTELDPATLRRIDLQSALPLEGDTSCAADGEENQTPSQANSRTKKKGKGQQFKCDPVLAKRLKKIQSVCNAMAWNTSPMTAQAALQCSIPMSELCDMEDDDEQALLDCIVLAHRFFERDITSLEDLPTLSKVFQNWDMDQYRDNEETIFMMMDFCLYPRKYIGS